MSLFNTQKKKVGNATAGDKLPAKSAKNVKAPKTVTTKAVALPKAEKVAEANTKAKNQAKGQSQSQAEKRAAAAQGVVFAKDSAVIKPRITEKAGLLSQKGIYTFDVKISANSKEIAKAIAAAYKVTPVKVATAPIKSKAMFVRGKKGKTVSGKKAYVYLKKGETIEFI